MRREYLPILVKTTMSAQGTPSIMANPGAPAPRVHPRTIGWVGTAALAMGGSNQSLFLLAALFGGQGDIPGQGSASIILLAVGLLLGFAAAPGWIELVLMSPNRVGGIAAACSAAFEPYGSVLSALTGVCYWWGWVPTCGLTALFSATAINQWALPGVPVPAIACFLVALFVAVNLAGIKWVTRVSVPDCNGVRDAGFRFHDRARFGRARGLVVAGASPSRYAFPGLVRRRDIADGWALPCRLRALRLSRRRPVMSQRRSIRIEMFRAPCWRQPSWRRYSSSVCQSCGFACLGAEPLTGDLGQVLGPTFRPLFGGLAKSAAIWFMMFNMFHGTMQPLAGAARTLSQLSDDGLLPRFLGIRSKTDAPWVATVLTAGFSILFLLIGDPIWLVAAANFTYLIGICLPNIAVWLLRRDAPDEARPWRAPRGTIGLGVAAALVWADLNSAGLPAVRTSHRGLWPCNGLFRRCPFRVAQDGRSACGPDCPPLNQHSISS